VKERGKVLVVEDNQNWQKDIKKCLQKAGLFVEVVDNLNTAIYKIKNELFHFITIDMELIEGTSPQAFQGWDLLAAIKKLRIQRTTPVMVITGFEQDYLELKKGKNIDALFFMGKGEFDDQKLIDIIINSIDKHDLHFPNDHRN
jgi:CheY-like chemotaxis protein